jgi:membrane-associated protease RseP (regulator of RpoE activity)
MIRRKLAGFALASFASLGIPAAALAHPTGVQQKLSGEPEFHMLFDEHGKGPHARVFRMGGPGRGRLGLHLQPLSEELRKFFGAPDKEGVLVAQVEDKSPAAKAGFKPGDVVVEVGDRAVDDAGDVIAAVAERKEGDKVPVVVVRDRKRYTLTATLEKPAAPPPGVHMFGGLAEVEQLKKQVRELEERVKKLEKR